MAQGDKSATGRILDDPMLSARVSIHKNVDQEILYTTIDKVRICLMHVLEDTHRSWAWQTPLAILASLSVVFPTTSFKDWLEVKAYVWEALFYFATFAVVVWLLRCLWGIRRAPTVDSIIEGLKKNSYGTTEPPVTAEETGEKSA